MQSNILHISTPQPYSKLLARQTESNELALEIREAARTISVSPRTIQSCIHAGILRFTRDKRRESYKHGVKYERNSSRARFKRSGRKRSHGSNAAGDIA